MSVDILKGNDPGRGNDGNGCALPAWAKTGAWLIREVGLPTVLAIILVGVLTGVVGSPLQTIPIIEARLVKHDLDVDALRETIRVNLEAQTRLFRLICQHTAKSDMERQTCEPRER